MQGSRPTESAVVQSDDPIHDRAVDNGGHQIQRQLGKDLGKEVAHSVVGVSCPLPAETDGTLFSETKWDNTGTRTD